MQAHRSYGRIKTLPICYFVTAIRYMDHEACELSVRSILAALFVRALFESYEQGQRILLSAITDSFVAAFLTLPDCAFRPLLVNYSSYSLDGMQDYVKLITADEQSSAHQSMPLGGKGAMANLLPYRHFKIQQLIIVNPCCDSKERCRRTKATLKQHPM